jgi:hypothetical protein
MTYRRAADRPQTVQSVFGGIVVVGTFCLKFARCELSDLGLIGLMALGLGVVFRGYIIDLVKLWKGSPAAK